MTLYIEMNVHTAERRAHNLQSLQARLKALQRANVPLAVPTVGKPTETAHCIFRVASLSDYPLPPFALSTGAWGRLPTFQPCKECKGAGTIKMSNGPTLTCWECHGDGKIKVQEVAA